MPRQSSSHIQSYDYPDTNDFEAQLEFYSVVDIGQGNGRRPSRRTTHIPVETKKATYEFDASDVPYIFEPLDSIDQDAYEYDVVQMGDSDAEEDEGDFPFAWMEPDCDPIPRKRNRKGAILECCTCHKTNVPAYFRCEECQDLRLRCQDCIVRDHQAQPFHWIEEWTGSFFVRRPLKQLGLVVQLGHDIGEICSAPEASSRDEFVVMTTSGIHKISLNYCGCHTAQHKHVQLLRSRLFPATVGDPRTAATFGLLEHFQLLSFMSKVSAFEYYQTLIRLTDNTGDAVPDRYRAFTRIVRQWRHIRLMKRMGRGHHPEGIAGTAQGECVVLCPACPHPGKNLPENYESESPELAWLYTLFVGIDANFRLKRLDVSSEANDPSLNCGYGYVVEERQYKQYLAELDQQIEQAESTCNNHDAIKSANMRGGKGLASSGVGTVDCSRHDMKRPTGVGDLQRGERYVNMDYLFFSTLLRNIPRHVTGSYDIACQWTKHLFERLIRYAPYFTPTDHHFKFLIPKWHIAAHQDSCRANFSFHYTRHVGRTDSEAPERGWAAMNGIATSTKEMGPGTRRDTLDDHFGDHNWRKTVNMCSALLDKVKDAVAGRNEQVDNFEEFSDSIHLSHPELIPEWTKSVQSWEADPTKPNPFAATKEGISATTVRLQLAKEDNVDLEAGNSETIVHDDISPSELLSQGLEIEEQQAKFAADLKDQGKHPTDLQQAKLVERRYRLRRRILAWASVQNLYMPGVSRLRGNINLNNEPVETIPLVMPSAAIVGMEVDSKLLNYEWRYRYAQAFTSLDELRGHLLMLGKLCKSKDRFVRGQRGNTRSQTLIARVREKIQADQKKYRRTRECLERLGSKLGKTDWQNILLPLLDEDVRGFATDVQETTGGKDTTGRKNMTGKTTEGRRKLSWIWKREGVAGSMDSSELLRLEWCKSRARAHRWQEECLLLEEEMRRVKQFFQHEVKRWQALADDPFNKDDEGRHAYALRQARVREQLYDRCINSWRDVPTYMALADGEALRKLVEYNPPVLKDVTTLDS
ncbi:hypothetical protein BDN72DRAFT_870985 [Pluteus cervinus]|uniref:Uncharacterized protein n=1 Tax=Pluteus cervinus TaxID=181527 RepID=A0ACD3ASQ4_9AGAR|nr:hypothetical protein BDN72DRAFT_870985 [Pluteus cervinus]